MKKNSASPHCSWWLLLTVACSLPAAFSQVVIGFDMGTERFIQAGETSAEELCVVVYNTSSSADPGGRRVNISVLYESRTALGKSAQ